MALYKSYAQSAGISGYTVKVQYEDVAGGFAGWFVARINGHFLPDADDDSNPDDGPDNATSIAAQGVNSGAEWYASGSKNSRMGMALVEQVNARLNHMFGVGHSAKWTATIVQDVTPAVINDDWGTP